MIKRKKLAPLPRVTSKTITVGALLGKIKRLIIAEPKRLNMRAWLAMFQGDYVCGIPYVSPPACGTVACIAGWGAIILRQNGVNGSTLDMNAEDAMTFAVGFGDGWNRRAYGLFTDHAQRSLGECDEMPPPGTPEHAQFVAKRIDTYLSQHPEIVKRKIVVADIQKMLRA